MSTRDTNDLENEKFDDDGNVRVNLMKNGLSIPEYDYVSVEYTDADTETYTFKSGGSDGVTKSTVVINYTDSTKTNISSVART